MMQRLFPRPVAALAAKLTLLLLAPFLLSQCADPDAGPVSSGTRPPSGVPAPPRAGSGPVLMIGDSLSVGSFGDTMQNYLMRKAGSRNVYFYASCGSSVQHWLAGTDTFVTKCGYRETRPGVQILKKYRNGRRPPPTATPKVESLLRKIRPSTVIVQLGTNHFDDFQRKGSAAMDEQRGYFESFARALKSGRPGQVIWVLPPDSAKFSPGIEKTVEKLILDICRRHGFMPVRSSALTRYVRGATGGDGVHYAEGPGEDWARRVIRIINHRF